MKNRPLLKLLSLLVVGHLALLLCGTISHRRDGRLHVTFLDVGQGDAAVIQTPSGKVLLVDTGGIFGEADDEGRRIVAPFLHKQGIRRIDAIFLTHPHADHIGGAATLMRQFDVDLLVDNGQPDSSAVEIGLMEAARIRHVPYRAAYRGQQFDCGDGVRLDVLAPTPFETQGTPNNASIVLRLQYGQVAFLFTGDAEAPEEADLLHDHEPIACDVLKVGHHGSRTSTTPAFLAAAHPRLAVISVGAHNLYGHPSPTVIKELDAAQVQVFRTDRNGAVSCTSDGVSIQITPTVAYRE